MPSERRCDGETNYYSNFSIPSAEYWLKVWVYNPDISWLTSDYQLIGGSCWVPGFGINQVSWNLKHPAAALHQLADLETSRSIPGAFQEHSRSIPGTSDSTEQKVLDRIEETFLLNKIKAENKCLIWDSVAKTWRFDVWNILLISVTNMIHDFMIRAEFSSADI